MDKIQINWRTPLVVIIAGCIIATIGFGIRSTFGLFLSPMTGDLGWSRETFGLAIALQNLFWGIGLPFAGALADKYGAVRVIVTGAFMYALGIIGMAHSESVLMLQLTGGILAGLGIAFSAFTIALAAMARVVSSEKRSLILGIGTAAGSFGQVVFSPLSQGFITAYGWHTALLLLSVFCLLMIPLAWCLPQGAASVAEKETAQQTLKQALAEALTHRGYVLLTVGFFVCGFHVAFITVHFPAYIRDLGMAPAIGAQSIALIGMMNIVGSFYSGVAGQKWSKKCGLAVIYFTRAIVIAGLLIAPKTPATMLAFSAAMGLLWLSTVPLTTGIVAQVFGLRYMTTLFGIVFLSHQLGSFMGIWLGGRIYDQTGSYDGMWWAGIILGLVAALLHIAIDEKPLLKRNAA